ncbi:MAG: hypothetical protein AAB377_01795 [Patescibacteria group bacterium]
MNDRIILQLKRLREIEPEAGFVAGSRRTILALKKEQVPVFVWPNLRMVGAFAGLVAVLSASIFFFSGQNAQEALASPEVLNNEFAALSINIELQEISYRQNVNKTISSAISEIGSTNANHMNKDVLNAESEKFNLDTLESNPQIDRLLEQVIF